PRGLDSVESWHGPVHHDDVGAMSLHSRHGRVTIGDGGHHVEIGGVGEQLLYGCPHDGVVVGDDDTNHLRTLFGKICGGAHPAPSRAGVTIAPAPGEAWRA